MSTDNLQLRRGIATGHYDVLRDDKQIGSIYKVSRSYSGMGLGTYSYWVAKLGTQYITKTDFSFGDKPYLTPNHKEKHLFDTRRDALAALEEVAR